MSAKIFRFVRHHMVHEYVNLGWIVHNGLDGTHHGEWSKLLEWPHEGQPIEPEAKEVPLAG